MHVCMLGMCVRYVVYVYMYVMYVRLSFVCMYVYVCMQVWYLCYGVLCMHVVLNM